MANLVTYKKPELLILSEKKKLREYEETELNTAIIKLIDYLLNILAVTDGKQEHHIALMQFIKRNSKNHTIEEIMRAFEMYVNNEFGIKVFQQLNAVVFGNVMKAYNDYKNVNLKNHILRVPQHTQVSQSEIDDIMEKAVENMKNEYKETGTLTGITHHIYDYLDKNDRIKTTDERKKELYKKAKTRITRLKESKKRTTLDKKTHRKLSEDLARVTKDESNEVINLAKHFALLEWLENT